MFEQVRAYFDRWGPLSETEWNLLQVSLARKHFNRRHRLIPHGTAHGWDVFVERGCLRVFWLTDDGLDRNLLFAPENSWICHSLLHAAAPPAVVGIEAIEDSDVVMIDTDAKAQICAAAPIFEKYFRLLAESSLELLQQRLILSMQNTAEGRYLEFTRRFPDLESRLTQYHIAAFLGISPEFLSKIKRRSKANRETRSAHSSASR
jgi:CRP-like cAMP-binding protein